MEGNSINYGGLVEGINYSRANCGEKNEFTKKNNQFNCVKEKKRITSRRKRANYIRGLIEGINLRGTIVSARKEEVGEKSRIN